MRLRENYTLLLTIGFCLLAFVCTAQLNPFSVEQLMDKAERAVEPDSTTSFLEEALALARLEEKNLVENVLLSLVKHEREQGRSIIALRYGLEAVRLGKTKPTNKNYFDICNEVGAIYQNEKIWSQALAYYKLAIDMELPANQGADKVAVCEQMGTAYFELNNIDSALICQQEVLDFYKKQNDPKVIINCYQKLVRSLDAIGDHQAALDGNLDIVKLVEENNFANEAAIAYNNVGYNYNSLEDYEYALIYFRKAEAASQEGNSIDEAVLYSNIGIAYFNNTEIEKAFEYFKSSEKVLQKEQNDKGLSKLYHLMATIYLSSDDVYNALRYNDLAIAKAKSNSYSEVLSETYKTAADIQQTLYDYEAALSYYEKHLWLRDSFLLEERLRQEQLAQQQILLERSEKEIKLLLVNNEVSELAITQLQLESNNQALALQKLALENDKQETQVALLQREQEVNQANLRNNELEKLKAQQELTLVAQKLAAETKDREITDLRQKEALQQLELAKKEAEEKERQREIQLLTKDKELLTKDKAISDLEIEKQEDFRRFAYGIGGLLSTLVLLIFGSWLVVRRSNSKLEQQNEEIEKQNRAIEESRLLIEKEKQKSDDLLLNILPAATANELLKNGVATPQKYKQVSILFTDFSEFTLIAAQMSPEELIEELNTCFIVFDEIVDKYNLEKIKIIGDSYMCAGGIPVANETNPQDSVNAAIEMMTFFQKRKAQKEKENKKYWDMRIGIHTGEVIAGVVGKKKFAYDIWGDSVNTASRLESKSTPGKINISGQTYDSIKALFNCTYRGQIDAKHKGAIDMYFVDGPKV